MSTSEDSTTNDNKPQQPLTRRQLREMRETGSIPVITAEVIAAASQSYEAQAASDAAADTPAETPAAIELEVVEDASQAESELKVSETLGAQLVVDSVDQAELANSFDELIKSETEAAEAIGADAAASDLAAPGNLATGLVANVDATGEVVFTGSFMLPAAETSSQRVDTSTGATEIEDLFTDKELPAHSSPTPIAASSAISTIRPASDVIKPPAPDKGSRMMLVLSLTAGVLGLALVGVFIYAFATGVFR